MNRTRLPRVFLLFLTVLFFLPLSGRAAENVRTPEISKTPYAAYLKSLSALRDNDFSAADSYLQEVVRLSPRNSEAWLRLGEVHLKTGRTKKALEAFQRAKNLDPSDKDAYYGLAIVYLRLNKPALARFQYETVLKLYPGEKQAWIFLADLYTAEGRIYSAINAYRQILKFLPENSVVLYNYGVILVQAKQYAEARRTLNRVIEAAPGFIPPRLLLAKINEEEDKPAEAGKIYLDVLNRAPNDRAAQVGLVKVYITEGKWSEAAGLLDKLPEPGDRELLRLAGFVYEKAGKYQRALDVFQKVLAKKDDTQTRFYLAIVLDNLDRDTEAAAELRKVIAVDPKHAAALNYLGYTLVERGESLDEAEVLIKNALRQDPDNSAYLDSLGWLYFKKGNLRFARYYLLRAASGEKDPEIYGHLVKLYEKSGDSEKAGYYRRKAASQPKSD